MPKPTGHIALSRRTPAILGGTRAFAEPLFITRPLLPDQAVFANLMSSVLRSRWFTNDGVLVRKLEERLRRRLGVGFCAVFCNGTMGLQAALRSLDLSGEVITTPFTFPATVQAIEWIGLTPVFCDIDAETYNLDVVRASGLLSNKTSGLLPVHVFGNPCDVMAIERFAEANGLRVIYDAAPAFGVTCHGRPIGCWGDLSVLSFHATKLFHTCEGGAVVGADASKFTSLALLRNFGIVREEEVRGIGVNGKLSELHAAMGLALLDLTDEEIRARGQLLSHYKELLSGVEGVLLQRQAADTEFNNAYFTIEIDEQAFGLSRDKLHVALRAENIITRKYFFPLCSENEYYRDLPSAQPERLPNAHRLASRILSLPLHADLTLKNVHRIVDCIVTIKSRAPQIRRAVTHERT